MPFAITAASIGIVSELIAPPRVAGATGAVQFRRSRVKTALTRTTFVEKIQEAW